VTRRTLLKGILIASLMAGGIASVQAEGLSSLEGSWIMDAAYEIRADVIRTTNYGEHPKGLLIIDHAGRYNLQIFRVGRPLFVGGDKAHGTPDEYSAASLGSSTHFGHVTIDQAKHQLIFDVEGASFPNWEGKRQVRDFTYDNGLLSYAVPASASSSGIIPYSIWRRAAD
jgi:Lipocalin-like domain